MFKRIPQKLSILSCMSKRGSSLAPARSIFMTNRGMMPLSAQAWKLKSLSYNSMRNFNRDNINDEDIEYVESKVFEVLRSAAKCDHKKLNRTVSFEDLGFDSLDEVELVVAMEEHLGIDLSNTDAEKVRSVMDAIQIFYDYYSRSKQPVHEE